MVSLLNTQILVPSWELLKQSEEACITANCRSRPLTVPDISHRCLPRLPNVDRADTKLSFYQHFLPYIPICSIWSHVGLKLEKQVC